MTVQEKVMLMTQEMIDSLGTINHKGEIMQSPEDFEEVISGVIFELNKNGIIDDKAKTALDNIFDGFTRALEKECYERYEADFKKLVGINNSLATLLQEQTDIVNSIIGE